MSVCHTSSIGRTPPPAKRFESPFRGGGEGAVRGSAERQLRQHPRGGLRRRSDAVADGNTAAEIAADKRSRKVLLEPVDGGEDLPVAEIILRDGPAPTNHARLRGGSGHTDELLQLLCDDADQFLIRKRD